MEFGKVTRMLSSKLNDSIVVYKSAENPGYVYKFYRVKDNEYRCCRCKELGKFRSIRVVDDAVVGRKNPESDHHPDCFPLPESCVHAAEVDCEMRSDIRQHGKRPREVYNEMLGNVTKRFRSSEQQVNL